VLIQAAIARMEEALFVSRGGPRRHSVEALQAWRKRARRYGAWSPNGSGPNERSFSVWGRAAAPDGMDSITLAIDQRDPVTTIADALVAPLFTHGRDDRDAVNRITAAAPLGR
jgi:hypothetical protein